jgi:hypothetical protein
MRRDVLPLSASCFALRASCFHGTDQLCRRSSPQKIRCEPTEPMTIRRRHRRILQVFALLLALANTALAQGGAWRCDTGQLCRGHAAGHCCCPPERQPAAQDGVAANGCCGTAAGSAQHAACSNGGRTSCCKPASLSPSLRAPCSVLRAREARHCRCSYTFSASPEASLEPSLLLSSPVAAAVPERMPTPSAAARTVAFLLTNDDPPPNLICLPPQGSRAPPAS